MNNDIFREYDIRGVFNTDFNLSDVTKIANAISHILIKRQKNNVIVGYDCRKSSLNIFHTLKESFLNNSIDVTNIGLCTTGMLYYSSIKNKADFAIMITASHNSKEYNGFKLLLNNQSFFGDQLQLLIKYLNKNLKQTTTGKYNTLNIKDEYLTEITKNIHLKRPLNAVWDCSNGVAGVIIPQLIKLLPGKHKVIFSKIDGDFPNHPADPSVEKNLLSLKKTVKEENFDIGFCFDGDADRVGCVDGNGNLIQNDKILYLLAKSIGSQQKNSNFMFDVKVSNWVFDKINTKENLHAKMVKTGHSNIKQALTNSPSTSFAGELSGHLFFKDKFFGFDCAIYSALRILEMFCQNDVKKPKDINVSFPKQYISPEIRIKIPLKVDLINLIPSIKSLVLKHNKKENIVEIDGLRINRPNGWWLIRKANTSRKIVLRFEGKDKHSFNSIKKELTNILSKEILIKNIDIEAL